MEVLKLVVCLLFVLVEPGQPEVIQVSDANDFKELDSTTPCQEVAKGARNAEVLSQLGKKRQASGWPVRATALDTVRLHRVGARRQEVLQFLRTRKRLYQETVIDVGGAMGGWTTEIADAYLDRAPADTWQNRTFFSVNTINDPREWKQLLTHVEQYGKYDFAICTMVLEDISTPAVVVDMLKQIAKAGYIETPSKFWELSKHCGAQYRGLIHHRWIFSIVDSRWTAFPKLGFLEHQPALDQALWDEQYHPDTCWNHSAAVLSFFWTADSFYLDLANGDFLGPTVQHIPAIYNPLIDDDTTSAIYACFPSLISS